MKVVNIGLQNIVIAEHIVAVVAADSSPIKRLKEIAKKEKRLIDATCGRKTKSVVITDSNHVILSALQVVTITDRLK